MAGLCAGIAQAQDLPKPLMPSDFRQYDPAEVALGKLLFFDPLLSGNRNISCATCHNPTYGTGDGLALGIGEGGIGAGQDRQFGTAKLLQSRNAPALWNLGARQVRLLFHDGRVELKGGRYVTPAGGQLPAGLNSLLAAQALFPLIARSEMAGGPEDNEIAEAAQDNAQKAWGLIAGRVEDAARYKKLMPDGDVNISSIVNAIAAYVDVEFRAVNTAFDLYLAGDPTALTDQARAGLELFYGPAGCGGCHSGSLLSDQRFHALAVPQFGPGLTRRFDPIARDVGRMAVTDDLADAYTFRTPFLRNVANTAPYGHNGAFATLREMLRHHSDPVGSFTSWTPDKVTLPELHNSARYPFALIADDIENTRILNAFGKSNAGAVPPMQLSETDISKLVAFLKALSVPDAPLQQSGVTP
nr:cytochrome c peroxidase [Amylibacter sp.]